MLSLKGKGARACPGLNNQIMRLIHALTARSRVHVVAEILHTRATHKARDDAPSTDHVEHGDLFGNAQWIIMEGQSIANDTYFRPFDALGQHGSHNVR